jgi:hypothetical protein
MLGAPMAKTWVEWHSSSSAAKNHRGQGKASFGPSLKATSKGSNALKSPGGATGGLHARS